MSDDYEVMASRRDIEDARRGYSIGGGGGFIAAVDRREVATQAPIRNRSANPQVLEGFACRYDEIHNHKGRKEMFLSGCFDGSLFGVIFNIDHDLLSKKLGDQDDGSLELTDNPIGLAFRLKLEPGHLDRIAGRNEMSPMYLERDVEIRQIAGQTVRVIKSASLVEISACYTGSVGKTFAVVRDAAKVGRLKDDAARSFPSDAAAAVFQRAMRGLSASL
jgi:hypothetical protein